MSKILLLGTAESHVKESCAALVTLGHGVLVVAPEILDVAGSTGVAQVCADPRQRTGRGQVGDLIRQRGPFDVIVQCVPAAAAPFEVTGFDEDDELLAAMSLYVALCKGVIGNPLPSGRTRLVSLRQVTHPEALDQGLAGFFAGMARDFDAGSVEPVDVVNEAGDWSPDGLAKLLAGAVV